MTREEALQLLDTIKFCDIDEVKKIKALDMAISALRAQQDNSCKKCNDLYDEDGGEILNDETVKDRHQMINADHIRAMDDEELAKVIFNWRSIEEPCTMCSPEMRTAKKCNGRCTAGILRWLHQPAEEN